MFENTISIFQENYTFSVLATCVIAILAYYISTVFKCKKSRLPPGPRGIPLLGNLLGMVQDPHLRLSEWAKQYGNLCTIRLAHRTALVVSDAKLLKELFGTMAATGKFKSDTLLLISQGQHGILNTEGNMWLEQRSFCMKNLKELGLGQSRSMEPLILDEAQEVCQWIRRETRKNNPKGIIHLDNVLKQATINALWTLVTGERFDLEDSQMGRLINNWMSAMQRTMKTGLGFFPWLKYIAPELSGYVEYDKACKDIHNFVEGKFLQCKSTYVEGQRRNLIDVYIEHMEKVNRDVDGRKSSFFGKDGWINSMSSVVELFVTGGDTMSVSLTWAAIYLSHNVAAQRKLQNEIDQVIDRDKDLCLLDKTRMPYTEAVLLEIIRLSSITPLGAPHELLEDISFSGYQLPKGLILMANLYHVHHDPDVWGDPDNFRPERFLDEQGNRLKGYIVAFQPGKRQCLGEQFAKDALFLFIVKLFQQFNVGPDPDIPEEEYFKVDVGMALLPKTSGLVITKR